MEGNVGRGSGVNRHTVCQCLTAWRRSQESHQLPAVLASSPLLPPGGHRRLDFLLDQADQELKKYDETI